MVVMQTCAVCGVAVGDAGVVSSADARVVCPTCSGANDAVAAVSGGPWKGLASAGAIVGAVPFGLSMATVSSSTVNGEVTSFVYRDWIAVVCGVIALVLGVVTLWMSRSEKLRRGLAIGAGIGVLALGGLQIARGFGVFATPPSDHSFVSAPSVTVEPPPKRVVDPTRPETCFDQDSCFQLGRVLEEANDLEKAAIAYTRACEEKAVGGCFNAGFLLRNRDLAEQAHAQFQRGCDLGYTAACNEAALAYKSGKGAPKDIDRARKMFDEGCAKDLALACTNLADFYANALGVEADPTRAFELFVKGCDLKDEEAAIACDRAGGALYVGRGVESDKVRATAYFDKGCELSPNYCYNSGVMAEHGDGTAKDLPRSRALYEKACKAGNPEGCNNLGHFFDEGIGGPLDKAAAKTLFQSACDAGLELGCTNLKTME